MKEKTTLTIILFITLLIGLGFLLKNYLPYKTGSFLPGMRVTENIPSTLDDYAASQYTAPDVTINKGGVVNESSNCVVGTKIIDGERITTTLEYHDFPDGQIPLCCTEDITGKNCIHIGGGSKPLYFIINNSDNFYKAYLNDLGKYCYYNVNTTKYTCAN